MILIGSVFCAGRDMTLQYSAPWVISLANAWMWVVLSPVQPAQPCRLNDNLLVLPHSKLGTPLGPGLNDEETFSTYNTIDVVFKRMSPDFIPVVIPT